MPNEVRLLSEREKEVARILLQGKSNKQIALELGISVRTVEFHLRNIYAKLGAVSRTEAVLKLAEHPLWQTPGGLAGEEQVEPPVAGAGDPTENDRNIISRRIPMKTLYYLLAGLLVTALIVVLTVVNRTPELDVNPSPAPVVPTPTILVDLPTATLPVPTQTSEPDPEQVVIPPHTVDGYTATIESYYIDLSHLIFQVRLAGNGLDTGSKFDSARLGSTDIFDEHGNLINSSGGIGPAADPELFQFIFEPTTLLKGDRFKGQFVFNLSAGSPDYNRIQARFHFDLDLPIYPEVRFYPKQTVTTNGLDMYLDSVTVTPVFTQVYVCFQPPSKAPWIPGNKTVIQIAGHEAPLYNSNELFSSLTGSYWGTHSEPYWVPPVKNGSCQKFGFQTGTSNPTSLTLTIPDLENILPYLQSAIDLDALYPGLRKREAYHTYLEENGFTYKGPWIFTVNLVPRKE
jgi:DNA-binding CsgD family transcriptional regulator